VLDHQGNRRVGVASQSGIGNPSVLRVEIAIIPGKRERQPTVTFLLHVQGLSNPKL